MLHKFEYLQQAFYDLRMIGIHHSDISFLTDEKVLIEKLGKAYWHSTNLEDDPHAPRAHFISEEAIGELKGAIVGGFFFVGSFIAMAAMLTPTSTLAASVAAIAIGGSPAAVIGTLLARRVGKHHKDYYANQIEHGGILPWVEVYDKKSRRIGSQDHERSFWARCARPFVEQMSSSMSEKKGSAAVRTRSQFDLKRLSSGGTAASYTLVSLKMVKFVFSPSCFARAA